MIAAVQRRSQCGCLFFYANGVGDAIGIVFLFAMIAAAVGLFIYGGFQTTYALLITFGVILCIFSVVPAAIFGTITMTPDFLTENLSGALMLVLSGIGVFLLVFAGIKQSGYRRLLHLNRNGTVGSRYVDSQKEEIHYVSKVADLLMSVYWPCVTILYLLISFLSFSWRISWIIWPIAAVLRRILVTVLESAEE